MVMGLNTPQGYYARESIDTMIISVDSVSLHQASDTEP